MSTIILSEPVVLSDTHDIFTILNVPKPSLSFTPATTFYTTVPITPTYTDLNEDVKVHARMTKFFYFKMLDNWFYNDLVDFLSYFTISGDNVSLIKKLSDFKEDSVKKDTIEDMEKKIDYIEKKIFSMEDMYNILFKFVRETSTNWYDLYKHESLIMAVVRRYLRHKIKKLISKE